MSYTSIANSHSVLSSGTKARITFLNRKIAFRWSWVYTVLHFRLPNRHFCATSSVSTNFLNWAYWMNGIVSWTSNIVLELRCIHYSRLWTQFFVRAPTKPPRRTSVRTFGPVTRQRFRGTFRSSQWSGCYSLFQNSLGVERKQRKNGIMLNFTKGMFTEE